MQLAVITAEELVPSYSYRLRPGVDAAPLTHARRIRASRRDGKVSIVYYFGPRGMEFDIEIAAGVKAPTIALQALDTTFQLDQRGRVALSDIAAFLPPVAFSTNYCGGRKNVSAVYRLVHNHLLKFEVGPHNPRERLIIDPAVTYATYFDSSGNDSPIALREMPDGSIFIAGNAASVDLPQGVSLNSSMEQPQMAGCFVARLVPTLRQIRFASYLEGASCSSVDIDSVGRILLVGLSESESGLSTSDAEYPLPRSTVDYFLARISEDGRTLEYATFLNMGSNSSGGPMRVRAGTGDFAYLSVNDYGLNLPVITGGYQGQPMDSDLVLLRYDLSAHHFDRKTHLAGAGALRGLEISSSGSPYIFGATIYTDLPLQNPVQTTPPTPNCHAGFGDCYAGFVAEFSSDLSSLLFSTYLGGQGNDSEIDSLVFASNGALRLAGFAGNESIPGLQLVRPLQGQTSDVSTFSVEIIPGNAAVRKGFLAGGYSEVSFVNPYTLWVNTSGLFLKDGRYCLVLGGYPTGVPPGGAAFQYPGPALGCLNDTASDFVLVTPVASGLENVAALVAPSSNGGIWSVQSAGDNSDEVPDDLLASAFQPLPPASGSNHIVLRYIDLGTATPVMVSPSPLELIAGAGSAGQLLNGRNFAEGMYLDLGGQAVPLTPTSSTSAIVDPRGTVNLVAGQYIGRLAMPTTPQALTSDPFPVTVSNLPPSFLPFATTSDPSIFTLIGPTYPTSQVTWRGQPLPIIPGPTPSHDYQVQLPAGTAPGPGELVQTNPRPGGGVESQSITFGGTGAAVALRQKPRDQPLTDLPADIYQVDRQRLVLYTAKAVLNGGFEIDSYDLGAGQQTASVTLPNWGANSIWDFQLSPDGSLLYLADNQFRIRRIQTKDLAVDLTFGVPADVPPSAILDNFSLRLMVLADAPESLLVTTPGGRMLIFDRDQPRVYSTDDFPSRFIQQMEPVVATSSYVYAVQNHLLHPGSPCILRYAIDSLGFSPPEEFCNPPLQWGKYAEMKTYDGTMVLEAFQKVRAFYDGTLVNYNLTIDTSQNLAAFVNSQVLPLNDMPIAAQIVLRQLDTGEPIGHLPSSGFFLLGSAGHSGGVGNLTVAGKLILFLETGGTNSFVGIIYDWPDNILRYP
ncbi:MAG TPA: hypothetical protein VMH80_28730 [Bryobacteraceae bacterium]|nr:hypothetical protein [Bryobacteraceae bacterium]